MQKRELWKVIVYGIVTLGIYDLVWLYKTRNELVAKGQKIPSFWLLFMPLFALIAAFVVMLVHSAAAVATGQGAENASAVGVLGIVIAVVALLASIPITLYWFYQYCKAVEVVTKGKLSLILNYIMLLILNIIGIGFLWPALVQDTFNKNT